MVSPRLSAWRRASIINASLISTVVFIRPTIPIDPYTHIVVVPKMGIRTPHLMPTLDGLPEATSECVPVLDFGRHAC